MKKPFFIRSSCKILVLILCTFFVLSGCTAMNPTDKESVVETLIETTEGMQSVQTAITFCLEGQYYDLTKDGEVNSSSVPHRASIDSKIDISASFNPLAFYSESFSNITVDGSTTQEARYGYTVRSDSRYIDYECIGNDENWSKQFVSRPDELTLPKRTGLICDWEDFMKNLDFVEEKEVSDDNTVLIYSGRISSTILQEIFGNRIFADFISNVEWVIKENVPCTLYLDGETLLPQSFELNLVDEFITHDVSFDEAKVTVSYSNWDKLDTITVPKKVSVLAEDHSAAVYSSFSTRDLFVPYEPKTGDATAQTASLPEPSKSLPAWALDAGLITGNDGYVDWYSSVGVLKLKKSVNLSGPIILPKGTNLTLDLNGFTMNAAINQPAIKTDADADVTLIVMSSGDRKAGTLSGHDGAAAGESGTAAIDFNTANNKSMIEITSAVSITGGKGSDNGAGSAGNGGVAIAGGRSKVYIKPESDSFAPKVQGGNGGKYTGTDKTAGVSGAGGSAISTFVPTTKDSTLIFINGGTVRGGNSGSGDESPAVSAPTK